MIDWMTLSGPWRGPSIDGGRFQLIGQGGEIETESPRSRRVTGSHDSTVGVRARGDGTIWLDGNPSKFLTGQNVLGSDDAIPLGAAFFLAICDGLGLEPHPDDAEAWALGLVDATRIDVTYSMTLRRRSDVLATIRAIEAGSTMSHRGRGTLTGGSTVYFGKNSRRWSLKVYSKGQELASKGKGHGLPLSLLNTPNGKRLLDHADPLLRIEVTLRALELKRLGLKRLRCWDPLAARKQHHTILRKLTMPKALPSADELAHIPSKLRALAAAHLAGVDTRTLVARATWYRHRKALLAFGIDLATNPPADSKPSNVVPFVRYIDITPDYGSQVPHWAHDAGFIPVGLPPEGSPQRIPDEFARRWPDRFPAEAEELDRVEALVPNSSAVE